MRNIVLFFVFMILLPVKGLAIDTTPYKFPVGFGTVSPMIEVGLQHDDNLFSQDKGPGVKSSWIGILAPAVLWRANSGLNHYSMKYGLESGYFFNSTQDNYTDHRLETDAHLDFDVRHRLDLNFDYLKLHERRGTGLTDNEVDHVFKTSPDKYRDILLTGKYTYGAQTASGNLEFTLSHLDRAYTNHRDLNYYFDRNETLFGAAFIYRFRANTSLTLEGNVKRIAYDYAPPEHAILDNKEKNVLLGARWKSSAHTTGFAKIGYERKQFDAGEYGAHSFVPWEVGLLWHIKSYSVVNVSTASQAEETTGSSSFIQARNILITWSHDWSERFTHTFLIDWVNKDYIDSILSRKDKTLHLGLGVHYLVRKSMVFAADYRFEDRNSNIVNKDYTRNIFMLSAKIGM